MMITIGFFPSWDVTLEHNILIIAYPVGQSYIFNKLEYSYSLNTYYLNQASDVWFMKDITSHIMFNGHTQPDSRRKKCTRPH